jgi:hypothetical protein
MWLTRRKTTLPFVSVSFSSSIGSSGAFTPIGILHSVLFVVLVHLALGHVALYQQNPVKANKHFTKCKNGLLSCYVSNEDCLIFVHSKTNSTGESDFIEYKPRVILTRSLLNLRRLHTKTVKIYVVQEEWLVQEQIS